MLEKILSEINNWFIVENGIKEGSYAIENNSIALPFLRTGQYFRIMGSIFNDGLHKYGDNDLVDEVFDGCIWCLAIPNSLIELSNEIEAWENKSEKTPYTSESFGGYTYSIATGESGAPIGWKEVFRTELNPYRKIRENGMVKGNNFSKNYYRTWNPDCPVDW